MIRLQAISFVAAGEALARPRTVMVTVNRRLARYLKHQYDARQTKEGRRLWETPVILPYARWLETCFDEAALSQAIANMPGQPLLLSEDRERRVWEQVIAQWSLAQSMPLLQAPETVGLVMDAWELCREWRISRPDLAQTPGDETSAFLQWADRFERICRKNNWLDRAGLADAVMEQMRAGHAPVPADFILAGFDELSPRQMELKALLESLGCRVWALSDPDDRPGRIRRFAFADQEAEMAAAAKWARDILVQHASEKGSDLGVGIVVPDLESRRASLARHLDDALHPSFVLSPEDAGSRAYNISLGPSLTSYPVVASALRILHLACRPLDVAEYGALLRSPHLAGAETELSRRSLLDARIREASEMQVSLPVLIGYAKNQGPDTRSGVACSILGGRLQSLQDRITSLPKAGVPSFWAGPFQDLLHDMGWPGERSLSSTEYQVTAAWREALARFSGLDLVHEPMDFLDAVDGFTRLLSETKFQPETGEVPVQVLGILEAAGEHFTHLWVMGLHAEAWPQAARPNPFLPAGLQRRIGLPHGSAEREAAFAGRILDGLLASAPDIIVSHPLWDGDTALFPSPLIEAIPETAVKEPEPGWRLRVFQSRVMETLDDCFGPEVTDAGHVHGGTGLLKAQAACPFSAFAAFRLDARPLETPEPGLNARERGLLVHRALEGFWESMKTQAALKALSPEERKENLRQAVHRAVEESASRHPRIFTPIFTRIETERLLSLLLGWLALDADRPAFMVSGHEKKMEMTLEGINLSTVADRIDRLADGRLVMIDYKTGEPRPADWFSERMAEPQLPLYCLAVEAPVAGVVFGQIKKGKVKYLGVVEDDAAWEGVSGPGGLNLPDGKVFSGMEEIIAFWRAKIEMLAGEVQKGVAFVAPVDPKTTCEYCRLGVLCRVREVVNFENIDTEEAP